VSKKITAFWDVPLCSVAEVDRRRPELPIRHYRHCAYDQRYFRAYEGMEGRKNKNKEIIKIRTLNTKYTPQIQKYIFSKTKIIA
jgi:hypothetical protein